MCDCNDEIDSLRDRVDDLESFSRLLLSELVRLKLFNEEEERYLLRNYL